MYRLRNTVQRYDWGSTTAIPEFLGQRPDGSPAAELWLGAHHRGPSVALTGDGEVGLDALIAADPVGTLGPRVIEQFGPRLPYLLKVLAAGSPLSLQVHPDPEQAREGFAAEEAAGVPQDSPVRSFHDAEHKPELVLALTTFAALSGFRDPGRVVELIDGIGALAAGSTGSGAVSQADTNELLAGLRRRLVGADAYPAVRLSSGEPVHDAEQEARGGAERDPAAQAVREAFGWLLDPASVPEDRRAGALAEAVTLIGAAAATLRDSGADASPGGEQAMAAYGTVGLLAEHHPGDVGALASIMLNHVAMAPGEAIFTPAGVVHAYLSGLSVEIMAGSDNVLRAGLTTKHVDLPAVLAITDYAPAPAAVPSVSEPRPGVRVYRTPAQEFALVLTGGGEATVTAGGPRIALCIDGSVEAAVSEHPEPTVPMARGESVFVRHDDGTLTLRGAGTVVVAFVP